MVFVKLSFQYWKKHKKRMLTLATVTMMGAVALCLVTLFIRSEKSMVLNQRLDSLGNYDAVFIGLEQADIYKISEHENVSGHGYYRELGYAGNGEEPKYKVISFPDGQSVDMYHMSCSEGVYPASDNEVAMDINTAKELGVVPKPGQKVSLQLFDMDKNEITTEEYVISGVFEASAPDVYRGFYRYPTSIEEYDVPVICLSDKKSELFKSSIVTVFIQTDRDVYALADDIAKLEFSRLEGWDVSPGRTFAYSYVTGIADHITDEYGELTMDSLMTAIKEGNVWKDFYSSVVVPLFGFLTCIIIIVSVFGLVRSLLLDRSEEIAILRSIGMEKGQVFVYLSSELLVLITFFTGIGILLGSSIHYLLIMGMNALYDINIPFGIQASDYVASVTVSPWLYTILVMEISSITAIFFPLWKMVRMTPVAVLEKRFALRKRKEKKHFSNFSKCSWEKLLGEHIHFYDRLVFIIITVVMCACFLGYNYFRALSELNSTEYAFALEESGLKKWDYAASKSTLSDPYSFMVENHHDFGIDAKAYRNFTEQSSIDKSFARMVNKSTRLSYASKESSRLPDFLDMRCFSASEDTFENAEYEAENAMIEEIGYPSDEKVYTLPSVGVERQELETLSPYVKEGTINAEKIQNGEEAVLVIPSVMERYVTDAFHVGDVLPLSDIALTKEEETYIFGEIVPADYKSPAYEKNVIEPETGVEVTMTSYAFGKRKNIETKVGAIVVLDKEKLLERYTVPYDEIFYGQTPDIETDKEASNFYTLSLVCLPQTFDSWRLPDKLFTEIKFSLREGADMAEANKGWYQIISRSKGVTFQSSYEIKKKIQTDTRNTMLIYYMVLFVLIIMGIFCVGIKFYSNIKLKSQTIARLRALGMPMSWIEKMIIRQNVLYPFLGAFISVIPVSLCQMFFVYIREHVDSGAWNGPTDGSVPWYHYIPFRYDLFGYHPVLTLVLLVMILLLLILLATLPQIFYLRKQVISESLDTHSF